MSDTPVTSQNQPTETSKGVPIAAAPSHRARTGCILLVLLILAGGGVVLYRTIFAAPPPKAKIVAPLPVKVAKATARTVPVILQAVGNVLPYSTVPVYSQITGQLIHVYIKQGDIVTKGEPLFEIDPRPLQAALAQAQANEVRDEALVGQDEATLAQSEANVVRDRTSVQQAEDNLARDQSTQVLNDAEEKRYQILVKQGFTTVETYQEHAATAGSGAGTIASDRAAIRTAEATLLADQQTVRGSAAAIGAGQATVKADQAAIDGAQVQLAYTSIAAPVSGRTGAFNLYQGTLIQAASATAMVQIDQITPIYVTFSIPEKYVAQLRALQQKSSLTVSVVVPGASAAADWPPGGQAPSATPTAAGNIAPAVGVATPGPVAKAVVVANTGRVVFLDQTVDTTTGTIAMRAEFTNATHALWPGQFVTIQLTLQQLKNATIIPQEAVQPGQQGDYVFVVKPDMTVESRNVVVAQTFGDDSVIQSGVKPGETVVTDGQLGLAPGSKVLVATHGKSNGRAVRGAPGAPSPTALK